MEANGYVYTQGVHEKCARVYKSPKDESFRWAKVPPKGADLVGVIFWQTLDKVEWQLLDPYREPLMEEAHRNGFGSWEKMLLEIITDNSINEAALEAHAEQLAL